MSPERRDAYASEVRSEYARIAATHARGDATKKRLSLDTARANAVKIDWKATTPKRPSFLGTKSFNNFPLADLVPYIDWTPFFQTWELTGRYPAILDDKVAGPAARALYDDAQAMLKTIVAEKWFGASATIGFWRANSEGDDIVLYADDARTQRIGTLHTLRQQLEKREGRANVGLSDYIAPRDSGVPDYIGGFVVTAGLGEDPIADRFKRANDDYSSIMVKALADRLAEAFAECMHQRVRKELWGYAPDETFTCDQLVLEQYDGIRPAPGYPAQPDHTEKATLFSLLDAERATGVTLTESYAMWPGASVCGLYFSHPESHYFGVGKIERDQVEEYAARKGWDVTEAERWLAPVLNYIPKAAPMPANDTAPASRLALHPVGCGCAVHRKISAG
jgi:5-methyltetrahydrofolate--homocysteine methyltransferase